MLKWENFNKIVKNFSGDSPSVNHTILGKLQRWDMVMSQTFRPFWTSTMGFLVTSCLILHIILILHVYFFGWLEVFSWCKATALKQKRNFMLLTWGNPNYFPVIEELISLGESLSNSVKLCRSPRNFTTPTTSSRKTEQMNGILKLKLAKLSKKFQLLWPLSFPLALVPLRSTPIEIYSHLELSPRMLNLPFL